MSRYILQLSEKAEEIAGNGEETDLLAAALKSFSKDAGTRLTEMQLCGQCLASAWLFVAFCGLPSTPNAPNRPIHAPYGFCSILC